jgi:hypothetical protein
MTEMNNALIDGLLEAGWLPPMMFTDELDPDTLTPLGFKWELEALGRFCDELGAVGPANEQLGAILTDYQMRAMLWRIVAEAEKATRS